MQNDALTGKANPLAKMQLRPPTNANIPGGLFGNTRDGGKRQHNGIDLDAPVGTPIYAMFDGVVQSAPYCVEQVNREGKTDRYPDGYVGDKDGAGNRIYITSTVNGEKITVAYWHLQQGNPVAINTKTNRPFQGGDVVKQGQVIAYTGLTGNANVNNKPHLHLGIKNSFGAWINPAKYLNATISSKTMVTPTPCDQLKTIKL